ncbi:hypothetical protein [Micromonospora wenchangensis]|uniref:hypothetical protein n=1 Tax=Micromonospora wenchangensis TaxID=1185415 RepID=UPI003D764F06
MAGLLPVHALAGVRVGVSVSESADLDRLGLREAHLRLALGELTRSVVVAGGGLAYGGRLEPESYTAFMAAELHRYARRDRPLLVCVAWHEHRLLSLGDLERFRDELGLLGRLVCLDVDGREVAADADRGADPVSVDDPVIRRRALTGLRRYMSAQQQGRVLIGGRRTGYQGSIPGLMEEALFALRARQPIYLAGGFGGVTADIARVLGADDGDWLPRPGPPPDSPGYADGVRLLRDAARSGWDNGLTARENGWLAVTHRPGEIAALVSLGLGRLNTGVR